MSTSFADAEREETRRVFPKHITSKTIKLIRGAIDITGRHSIGKDTLQCDNHLTASSVSADTLYRLVQEGANGLAVV
jgi:hypothetical protein